MKAVSTRMDYRVSFNPATGSYILKRNSGGMWFDEGAIQTLPSQIQISAITFPGKDAQFDSRFGPPGGSITLQSARGDQKRVTVSSANGKVTVNQMP